MKARKTLRNALFVASCLMLLLVGVVSGEARTVSNVAGNTWHGVGVYRSQTTSGSPAPYISVHLRAWGQAANLAGREIKEQEQSARYSTAQTGVVDVLDNWNGGTYTSRHIANTQSGSVEIHTSATGCTSNYCWWNTGSPGCAATC